MRSLALTLLALCLQGCTGGEPPLASPGYFERILGVPAAIAAPEYLCRRESMPDVSLVAAYQLPPADVERLRADLALLQGRPHPLEYERDRLLVTWTRGVPSGEAAEAIRIAFASVPYVEGGDCTGSPYVSARVLEELPAFGAPDTLYALQYKRYGPDSPVLDVIDLHLLDLRTGRYYLVVSDG